MTERRVRRVYIDPQVLMTMFQDWKDCRYIAVLNVEGVPKDCVVVSVNAAHTPFCIELIVSHPSFAPVQPGEMPPPLYDSPAMVETVLLKVTKETDEYGHESSVAEVPSKYRYR